MKTSHSTARSPNNIDKLATGRSGENLACELLQRKGFEIVARNIREKFAEIDIVAKDRCGTLIFVEVRTRKDARLGHPSETIGLGKQRSVRRAAEAYLTKNRYPVDKTAIRFDVVTVVWDTAEIEHFENAF